MRTGSCFSYEPYIKISFVDCCIIFFWQNKSQKLKHVIIQQLHKRSMFSHFQSLSLKLMLGCMMENLLKYLNIFASNSHHAVLPMYNFYGEFKCSSKINFILPVFQILKIQVYCKTRTETASQCKF